jgi:acyl-CoA thioesterase-1
MAVTPARPSRRILLGAPLAAAWAAKAQAARGPVVTMLGDSITAGLGLPVQDALPAELHLVLERMGVANVVRGAGVSGDTTAAGLARMDFSIEADTAVVVVALGANDLLRGIDPTDTRANLNKILQRLAERRMAVVLAGIHAPDQIGREYARDYNAIFPDLARKYHTLLYPDLLAGVGRDLRQSDGLHPNAAGARHIAAGLAPLVARLLKQKG